MRPDILVSDVNGGAILAVEVKARRGVDSKWAQHLRRNLSAHGAFVAPEYFMVVTTDEAFLWRDQEEAERLKVRPPDFTAPTRDLLGERLPSEGHVDGRALELVVSAWLNSVAASESVAAATPQVRAFVVGSGLHDALRASGNVIAFEVA
mgnify:CR=1 FL=1